MQKINIQKYIMERYFNQNALAYFANNYSSLYSKHLASCQTSWKVTSQLYKSKHDISKAE